jgi:CRISPR type III-A-associated protein Csm2
MAEQYKRPNQPPRQGNSGYQNVPTETRLPSISIDLLSRDFTTDDINLLEKWGRDLGKEDSNSLKMTTSQIRKFFGEIKRIQADFCNAKRDIVLLDPKIAYAVGRAKKGAGRKIPKLEGFYRQLSPLLKNINGDESKFRNFVSICEAIVAYHKAESGD